MRQSIVRLATAVQHDENIPALPHRGRISLIREALLVVFAGALLAVASRFDTMRHASSSVPKSADDTLYFAWQLAWVRHAFLTDAPLWTTNAFSGARGGLAFTDTMLGYLPISLLTADSPAGALTALNIATAVSTAAAFVGAYALARALGSNVPGALTLAATFGFAPWRTAHIIHLNVISTGGMALAYALLARGRGWSLRSGLDPGRFRPGLTLAGWAVAAAQLLFGFATGIWFAYSLVVLALVSAAAVWHRRRVKFPWRRQLACEIAGAVVFLAAATLLVWPHLQVLKEHPEASRNVGDLPFWSPRWFGLLTGPSDSLLLGGSFSHWREPMGAPVEHALSPGLLLYVLAGLGLVYTTWRRRYVVALAASTAVLVVLAMGVNLPTAGRFTYLPLRDMLPGWDSLRTPGRLIIWISLTLGVLAAGFVSRLYEDLRLRTSLRHRSSLRSRLVVAVALLPMIGALLEGQDRAPQVPVPIPPVRLAVLQQPVLVIPSDRADDYRTMFWTTDGWPLIANGDSGFLPIAQAELRTEAEQFPSEPGLSALSRIGVRTVVVLRGGVSEDAWQVVSHQATLPGAQLKRVTPDAVVIELAAT